MIKIKKVKKSVRKAINNFPTDSSRILRKNSYFYYVYSLLSESNSFLEIGYRKGLFVEVCKILGVKSQHIDITDRLLKATPSKDNKIITRSSIDYLENTKNKFDLIFQDGSKNFKFRKKEYDIIVRRKILKKGGKIIVDDLHHKGCKKAFLVAIKKHKFNNNTYSVAGADVMGLLY